MIIQLLSLKNIIDFEYYTKYLEFISHERRTKIDNLKINNQKITSILAELLIRYNIFNNLNIKNQDINFVYNEYGKPSLKNSLNFNFSISHTDDTIAFISDSYLVGIDIETIKKSNLKLAKRFFTFDEYQYIKNSISQDDTFFKIWTIKEAYIKMLGTGLYTQLNSFNVLTSNKDYYHYSTSYNNCMISICSKNIIKSPIEINLLEINMLLNFFDNM